MSDTADRRRYLIWRSLSTALEQLPVPVAVRVAESVAWTLSLRKTSTRDAVEDNLRALLEFDASTPVDARVLRRWVRRSYASYARYWAEGATLPGIDPGVIHARIDMVDGLDVLTEAMAQGKGVVMALPHIGSWEWGGAFLARINFPMTAVAEVLEPPELFDWFITKRRDIGLHIEPLDADAGRNLLSTLSNGGLVGLLCDRDITGDGIPVTMCGRTVRMPAGPATLALRTGAILVAGVVYSGPGGEHCAHITGPIATDRRGRLRADVARVTQEVADHLGASIVRAPEQWHVFSPAFHDPDAP